VEESTSLEQCHVEQAKALFICMGNYNRAVRDIAQNLVRRGMITDPLLKKCGLVPSLVVLERKLGTQYKTTCRY
jgi:hypothetical protein